MKSYFILPIYLRLINTFKQFKHADVKLNSNYNF